MISRLLTLLTFVSVIVFPWPFTVLLALACSFTEPLVPLAVGLFADTLYYTPQAHSLPIFAFCGAVVTVVAFFVRSRLRASSIRG